MKKINEIDRNFSIETEIKKEGITFFDVKSEPFKVYGIIREGDEWVRMKGEVARATNEGVANLYKHTAGGRVRFVTDSPYVAIKTRQPKGYPMSHIALTGQGGFDLYVGEGRESKFYKAFVPPLDIGDGYESIVEFADASRRTVTINFPLYYGVCELYVGLDGNASVGEAEEYEITKPIVYYGSSITQGGCASRPGTCYQAYISRWFNADHINLGFSGNAKGEDAMADYIASLDMSLFVYDYDHNAPTNEHLLATHERMFKRIRAAHPTLPIIIASRPKAELGEMELARLGIIRATYERALAEGDENVYFVDGRELMSIAGQDGTVDGCHPTDLGFFSMAKRFAEEIDKIGTFRR